MTTERALRWRLPLLLFLLTVASVLFAGASAGESDITLRPILWWRGWTFALPLLGILLAHEFGHYIAARRHQVPASLPYFLPMPFSPFGTWGAVIVMPQRIASRRALLDIGAAGPLAGMVVAIPVLCVGLALSPIEPLQAHGILEGQCILYWLLKRIVLGVIPAGYDVTLHPVAFAGWAGLFVTMINLLPVGQLDGGHIAYALVGPRQDRIAQLLRRSLLGLFGVNLVRNLWSARAAGYAAGTVAGALSNSTFWLFWFVILTIMGRVSGVRHPPTEPGETLGRARTWVALGSLLLFALLFMPAPFTVY